MTSKEALFFIGKCLTINHEKHNKTTIEKELNNSTIDWDIIVKVSTAHYVFPALYCNLKRANFLHYLPEDLVSYMNHITDLNRERNLQIIKQAKEINELLLANNITPIFLKGTGNLLEGLYDDIAERMVGDIDFLVDLNDCKNAFEILQKNGYHHKVSELFDDHRHLPRITNKDKIAALEIHKSALVLNKSKSFNYSTIKNSLIKKNKITFLSNNDKMKLSVFSKLINDNSYLIKNIHLRAIYDFFLIGQKLTSSTKLSDTSLQKELNCGILLYTTILDRPKNLNIIKAKHSQKYTDDCIKKLSSKNNQFKYHLKLLWIKERIKIILKSFYKKSYFKFVFSKITDINWYKKHLKPKSKL